VLQIGKAEKATGYASDGSYYNRLTSNFDLSQLNPISGAAQAAYAAILANPANPNNAGVKTLAQILPASQFRVPGVVQFAGMDGHYRGFSNPDNHEWQPRAGFAYRLARNTTVRGGFGRFVQADYERGGQKGFSRTTSFIATQDNYVTPYDTLANPRIPTFRTIPRGPGSRACRDTSYVPKAGDTIKNCVYQDFGTYVRNYPTRWGSVRASRVNNVDLGLYKNIRYQERLKLQLRFNVFNAFNHVRFGAPNADPTSSNFGRVTLSEQNQARAVELGARLTF
jgi:hypothetical protein